MNHIITALKAEIESKRIDANVQNVINECFDSAVAEGGNSRAARHYQKVSNNYAQVWSFYQQLSNEELIVDRIDMRGKYRDLAFRITTTFFGTLVVFLAYGFVGWLGFDLPFKFHLPK